MLNHPQAEFDIRLRQRWFAEALAAQSNLSIDPKLLTSEDLSDVAPPVDDVSWFALQRLAKHVGLTAVRFEREGDATAGASLVWVSPSVTPNENDAKEIARFSLLVVASDEWTPYLNKARADIKAGISETDPSQDGAVVKRRKPGP